MFVAKNTEMPGKHYEEVVKEFKDPKLQYLLETITNVDAGQDCFVNYLFYVLLDMLKTWPVVDSLGNELVL